MEQSCHVEPISKAVTPGQLQDTSDALLAVWGMGCPNCATRVQNSLLSLDGVVAADVNLQMAMAEVRYEPGRTTPQGLVDAVARAGNDGHHVYRAQIVEPQN